MNSSRENSFIQILKSSTLLGFASLINVLLGIIRVKVLAVQLGPSFFGTISLYTNFINTIGSITSLGIGQSAVRDIAAVAGSDDKQNIPRKVAVLHRVAWITGILGFMTTIILAIPGSFWIFGNYDHAWAIAILAVIVLLNQIQAGQGAILSGLRRIGDIAKMNIIGGVISTILAVVLLLSLKENGIVPFLIAVAIGTLSTSWWYARKINVAKTFVSWRECYYESREMTRLGISIVISGIAGTLSTLLVLVILRKYEGESSVGLYQSAFTISSIYISFILQAMSGDYFPRLAGVAHDNLLRNQTVNEQAEMAMLVAVPGLVAVLVAADILIPLLYSSRFDGATEILHWQVLGMLGSIISWPPGFILMARSDKTSLLASEWLTAILFVALVWLGVNFLGYVGAGVAFALQSLFHAALIFWMVGIKHDFSMANSTRKVMVTGILFVALAFGATFITPTPWRYLAGFLILLLSAGWTIHRLIERLGYERIMNGIQKRLGRNIRIAIDRILSRFYR